MYNYENLYRDMPKGKIAKTLTDRITDELICGNLKPGDRLLTEVEFSKNLHVGRNAVRESMKVLEAFGVVEIRRAEGTFIASAVNQNMIDSLIYNMIASLTPETALIEFKTVFITSVLSDIMNKVTQEDINELREICDLLKYNINVLKPKTDSVYRTYVNLLHRMAALSGNDCIEKFMEMIIRFTMPVTVKAINNCLTTKKGNEFVEIHTELVELLRSRDNSQICRYADRSLEIWRKFV